MAFFQGIADRILQDIQPASVLDAGCAMGFLVEGFRKRGVEAWGVDISSYAIQNVHPDIQTYCWVGSISEPFPQKYDLIVSIEVLEHVDARQAEQAVQNFCAHSDDILFSSTPFDYTEPTHRNVQPPEYWAELFARQGFYRDVEYDASFITNWAIRFRRSSEPVPRIIRGYERRFWQLWNENVEQRRQRVSPQESQSALEAQQARISELEYRLGRYENSRIIQFVNRILEIRRGRMKHL